MTAVLYVDDEPTLLDIAKEFLERDEGITVETSNSAMDALVRLETRHFDAIVCDYQMPVVDGLHFLKTIRMQGRTIPFILFTGRGREDVVIEALNNGADFYLQKGGDPKAQFTELTNMIKRSVEQRRAADSLLESEEIYEKLFKDNIEAMILVDPKTGAIVDANESAISYFGHERERMLAMHFSQLSAGHPALAMDLLGRDRIGQGTKALMPSLLASGEVRDAEVFSGTLRVKGRQLGYAIIHDITELRRSQRREERLGRVLKVLSYTSQLILHARSELALLEGACRALVEHGGYQAAWIGSFDASASQVREVVRAERQNEAGAGSCRLSSERAMALALRTRRPDSHVIESVGAEGRRQGCTYAAFPLTAKGEVGGAMVVLSDDPLMEGSEELLLGELADNLSEAIALSFEREVQRADREHLVALGQELSGLLEAYPHPILLLDREMRVRHGNRAALQAFQGTTAPLGLDFVEALSPSSPGELEGLRALMAAGGVVRDAGPYPCGGGWFVITSVPTSGGQALLLRDVTAERQRDVRLQTELSTLDHMIETSPAGMAALDLQGRYLLSNQRTEELLGMGQEELVGLGFDDPRWSISYPDGAPIPREDMPFQKAMESGRLVWGSRLSLTTARGEVRCFSVNAAPHRDGAGAIIGAVVSMEDITPTLETESALERSQSMLKELISSSLDVLVRLDSHGLVSYVSPSIKDLIGLEPDQVMGRPAQDFVHPEDAERVDGLIMRSAGKEEASTARLRLRKGDTYLLVEALGRVILDERGELQAAVGSLRKVSDRQATEDRLWETGSKLRAIIQTSPMAIVSLDPDGAIATWNPAAERVFGWGGEDAPESLLMQGEGAEALLHRIMAGEMVSDAAVTMGGRTVSLSSAPTLDQSGKVSSIIVVASDMTERKAMEDRLIQLNDVLRLVNRILRHDTLNELMVLSGSLDMFQRTKQDRFLVTATKAVNRSMEMIKRMKELESLAASGGAMRQFDLRQTVENVLRGYMVEFTVEGEGSIYADDALPSAIDNIVRNAMVHGKADRIEAKVWVEDGRTWLRIADNGSGIPEAVKRRVFEEGFSYGANAGTGLGLYLVTKAVERYRGKVSVEDNAPRGAAFVMVFPAA